VSIVLAAFLVSALSTASVPAPETATFALYKWQKRIGVERSTILTRNDAVEIKTAFGFTDRNTTVPLAATLVLRPDDPSPRRFQIWGSTSRFTTVDDLVGVASDGRTVTIEERGSARTVDAPPVFFTASSYAPMIVTERLYSYWLTHGRPDSIPLFPEGEAHFERRGEDAVTDDDGKSKRLERYALTGIGWGRETLWFDDARHLAVAKMVDDEFDHFEATRDGYASVLAALVARAAEDGMAELKEKSRQFLADPGSTGPLALVGATLVDGTGAPPVPDAALVIAGGRIVAAGPRATVSIPAEAKRLDVTGKTLLPGLWDMHAHFEQIEWGPLYLAAGVTTVRDCGNELDFIKAVRNSIDAGEGVGPRVLLACLVDGQGEGALGNEKIRTADDIDAVIKRFADAGCAQVKLYSSIDPRLIEPIARSAHRAGMTVTGHVPDGIGAVHAVEAGLDGINHLYYVTRALFPPAYDPDKVLDQPTYRKAIGEIDLASASAKRTLAFFAEHRTVVDPTLALGELFSRPHDELVAVEPGLAKIAPPLRASFASFGVSPENASGAAKRWAVSVAVLRALHDAGVTIVAGTDQAVPGHSLHRELELYVAAGFTPLEAIQAATIVPARVMHRDKEVGTLEAGKRADVIVVDGDPLADIRNLRRTVEVVYGGRVYDTAKLWRSVGFDP
jgi:imidazolonepropionase-like amidohydrolase